MSLDALKWAFDQTPDSPTQKFVLVALADYHNSATNKCFPSLESIAQKTSFSKRAVIKAVQALKIQGLIDFKTVRNRSNKYQLKMNQVVNVVHLGGERRALEPVINHKAKKYREGWEPKATNPDCRKPITNLL